MTPFRLVLARLRALFRRNATIDEIREERQFHVQMRTDELAQQGLDPHAARQVALHRFGNPTVIQDRGYDVRGGGMLETIVQDVKYGIRQLRHQPSFSIVAILTLALGIGVSTALFSVIDAALLRPLPYPNPEELVTIHVEDVRPDGGKSRYAPSMADIRRWQQIPTVIAHAGLGRVSGFTPLIVEAGAPQRLIVAEASEDFLETYGVLPILGRGIHVDDTREGRGGWRSWVTRSGSASTAAIHTCSGAHCGSRMSPSRSSASSQRVSTTNQRCGRRGSSRPRGSRGGDLAHQLLRACVLA